MPALEGATLAILVVAGLWTVRRGHAVGSSAWLVRGLLAAWLIIAIELFFLPTETAYYHWMLGTPFQYAGIGMAFVGGRSNDSRARRSPRAAALLLITAVFVAARLPGLAVLESDVWRGATSSSFNPSLTRIGEVAALQPDNVLFVAADWGVATQIVCLSNGRPGLVDEAFWSYGDGERLPSLLERHPEKSVFIVTAPTQPTGIAADRRRLIFDDFQSSLILAQTALVPALKTLQGLTVKAYIRR
jgi:hypothetical protein